MNEIIDQ